jgi:hypothetical protein
MSASDLKKTAGGTILFRLAVLLFVIGINYDRNDSD